MTCDFYRGYLWGVFVGSALTAAVVVLTACASAPPQASEQLGPAKLTNPSAIRSLRACEGRYPAEWCR